MWDPFMRSMDFLDGADRMAKGVKTRTVAYNRMTMDTVFVAYDPPNVIAMEMVAGPFLFRSMAGTWRFHAGAGPAGETRADFIYNFSTRPALLKPLLDRIVGSCLGRDMERRISRLKAYAEDRG